MTKKQLIEAFKKVVKKNKYIPTLAELKNEGISRNQITKHFLNYTELKEEFREEYPGIFKQVLKEKQKVRSDEIKKELLDKYIDIVKNVRIFPTREDLADAGITRDQMRHHFKNMKGIRDAAKEYKPNVFEGSIDIEDYVGSRALKTLNKYTKGCQRFIITTAVNGQWAHKGFLDSIDNYCKKNKAKLLILPSNDPAHNLDNQVDWHFDSGISEYPIIFEEFSLNSNLHVSSIRVNAKQINPTTGLSRISQGNGSFIFASPKQALEAVPVSNVKMPHVMMSTGACTLPNYSTTRGNSMRTAKIAEYDHLVGGIVVEIRDNEIFHFRQIQADEKGGFTDLGTYYCGDKTKFMPSSFVAGDWHAGETDETAKRAWYEAITDVGSEEIILHDVYNGLAVNPHEEENIILRARRAKNSPELISLEDELRLTADEMIDLTHLKPIKRVVVTKSNHDDFLNRWLKASKFRNDPRNYQLGCDLASAYVDGVDPLVRGLELCHEDFTKYSSKIKFLKRDEDYKIAGIECGAHGDKGPNGARRAAKPSLERCYGKCNVGHSHTPGILRGVYQVGTTSILNPEYQEGPSSWMHCSMFQYHNGHRQLIISIDGKWRL